MGPGNERGPGNKLGAQRAEQFPHLGNYTLTPAYFAPVSQLQSYKGTEEQVGHSQAVY